MRGGREAAAVAAAALVILGGCTSTTTKTASTSPETSPSATSSATQSSAPTPSPAPTPTGPLTIKSVPVHNGEVGLSFASITLSAGGGLPPYTWGLQRGALPSGLGLSPQGVISGSVSKAGTFKFTVSLADSGGSHATKATSITVYSALSVTAACAGQCVVGKGCSKCGGFGTASGGATPYAFKVIGGGVPGGMSLSGLSLKGGFPAGSYSLTVKVTDKLGASGNVLANWSVYPPATLKSGGNCYSYNPPPACTIRWTYSGGSPTAVPKLVIISYSNYCSPQNGYCSTPAGPPPGWAVSVKSGVITISTLSTACVTSYVGDLKLALVDTAACATTASSNPVDLLIDMQFSC